MIPVTPLEGRSVLLNVNSIELIEEAPETVLVLAGGRRMVVVDVAEDLVARINKVRARLLASAAESRGRSESSRNRLRAVSAAGEPPDPSRDVTTGGADTATPALSTSNVLHMGQVTLDRVLASIARCRSAVPRRDLVHFRRELGAAHDGIETLASTLDHRHSGGVTQSAIDILVACADRLAGLEGERLSTVSPQDADAVLRTLQGSLTTLRKAWARIAADTSYLPTPGSFAPATLQGNAAG